MIYKAICLIFSIVLLTAPVQAAELCGTMAQGGVVMGHDENIHEVIFNGKKIPVSEDGHFFLAFGRDDKLKQKLKILYNDEEENYPVKNYTFNISATQWDIQKINGVPERKVTPKEEDRNEILRENQSVRKALEDNNSNISFWKKGFKMPMDQYRISGKFGGQRIINTIKKNPHQGMDMAAPEGSDIEAPSDGVIVLSGGNFFYSGNMVIIDHGQGLHTIYAHMKDVWVTPGQRVIQGQILGTVGKTGRVTGPHLHWGASANGTRFNPETLLKTTDKKSCLKL